MSPVVVPMVIRGRVIDSDLVEFGTRGGGDTFLGPDPVKYLAELPLREPGGLADIDALTLNEIVDYLVGLGPLLDIDRNEHLKAARELAYSASPNTAPIVDEQYAALPGLFEREYLQDFLDYGIDRRYLDSWVEHTLHDGSRQHIHAFGARVVHISAGNGTLGAALGIIRSALTRGDAIMKSPSNDPMTAAAIALTMCEFAPDHPVTRHVSVAYWRGGDETVESVLYDPNHIEKILAWGGYVSIKHVVKYLQPGLELIQFDPKTSISIVDLSDPAADLDDAAARLARDIGLFNQNGCTAARVVYTVTGSDAAGLTRLHQLAERAHAAILRLPEHLSTKPKGGINPELREHLDTARLNDLFYRVTGGSDQEGAIIESLFSDPVEFAGLLQDRVANLVPIDTVEDAFRFFDAYTQTVGVYPPKLAKALRHRVGLNGGQRVAPLGHASMPMFHGPQDAFEPLRRMCRWVTMEDYS
jgi:hypothetical protein